MRKPFRGAYPGKDYSSQQNRDSHMCDVNCLLWVAFWLVVSSHRIKFAKVFLVCCLFESKQVLLLAVPKLDQGQEQYLQDWVRMRFCQTA